LSVYRKDQGSMTTNIIIELDSSVDAAI